MTASLETEAPVEPASSESATAAPSPDAPLGLPLLTIVSRAAALLAAEGLSVGLALGLVLLKPSLEPYLVGNVLGSGPRSFVLGMGLGTSALAAALAVNYSWRRRREPESAQRLRHVAQRLAPLGVAAFLPALFRWQTWNGRDLVFLTLVALAVVIFESGLRAAMSVGPLPLERPLIERWRHAKQALMTRWPRVWTRMPLIVVCSGALGYAIYFSYYTCAFHWAVRSGFDLGLENNLMWNLARGEFFKSSPLSGPTGSHFGFHATLFSYLLLPIYLIAQRCETLLIVQAALLGGAAIPLFLFARLHVSQALAAVIALVYLLYPPLHGPTLFEFHYLPLGTFFLWTSLYALEARRDRLAVVAVIIALSVREDVAAGLSIWGAYLLLSGRRPRVGLGLAALGGAYFILMKMFVMPRFAGQQTFTDMFQGLLPEGENSFGAVLKTVVGNPYYTAGTLLEPGKLIYLLQLFVPLAFLPLRRAWILLFVVPGFLFTLLSTGYGPLISIHYQYPTNWTTYIFVAMVLVFAALAPGRRHAALGALCLATLACSYQYGAILQQNTAFGGPIPFRFGINDEDRLRRRSLDAVVRDLPPDAKVSASGFVTPQISSRADAYNLTVGLYDAEYIVFPSEVKDFIVDERQTVTELLKSEQFGVVSVVPPFALAKRGHAPDRNAELMARWPTKSEKRRKK